MFHFVTGQDHELPVAKPDKEQAVWLPNWSSLAVPMPNRASPQPSRCNTGLNLPGQPTVSPLHNPDWTVAVWLLSRSQVFMVLKLGNTTFIEPIWLWLGTLSTFSHPCTIVNYLLLSLREWSIYVLFEILSSHRYLVIVHSFSNVPSLSGFLSGRIGWACVLT